VLAHGGVSSQKSLARTRRCLQARGVLFASRYSERLRSAVETHGHEMTVTIPDTMGTCDPAGSAQMLVIAGVKLHRVLPEQLALGGLWQIPTQHGLHRLGKPALPVGVV
jgi:hypothetical protein